MTKEIYLSEHPDETEELIENLDELLNKIDGLLSAYIHAILLDIEDEDYESNLLLRELKEFAEEEPDLMQEEEFKRAIEILEKITSK